MSVTTVMPDVLTLDEVAQYLRLPSELVERQALKGNLPGRQVEGTWRFLKAAVDSWLSRPDGRTALLQQAGALADDDQLEAMLADIYAQRGRPADNSPADT